MTRLADRRTILLAAAAVAAAARGWSGTAASHPVDLTIGFEGGGPIPKGRLVVYLDAAAGRPLTEIARLDSDGGRGTARLALALPVAETSSPRQIVAELQRPDGWLLARGSTQVEPGSPAAITLYTVLYQE